MILSQHTWMLRVWRRGSKYPFYSLWFDPTGPRIHDQPHSRRARKSLHHRCGYIYINIKTISCTYYFILIIDVKCHSLLQKNGNEYFFSSCLLKKHYMSKSWYFSCSYPPSIKTEIESLFSVIVYFDIYVIQCFPLKITNAFKICIHSIRRLRNIIIHIYC